MILFYFHRKAKGSHVVVLSKYFVLRKYVLFVKQEVCGNRAFQRHVGFSGPN